MASRLKEFAAGLLYWFINHIVTNIPCWPFRRSIFILCGMRIEKGSRILLGTQFQGINHIRIGRRSYINSYCHLDGRGGLTIGDNVNISNYSKIISASHDPKSSDFAYRKGSVEIGDHCWLGTGAIVLDRSRLGNRSILSAGSVLKGIADADSVYVGIPAEKVKERGLRGEYDIKWKPFFS